MQFKRCSKCGYLKAETNFYKDKCCKMGRLSYCKSCMKERDREPRQLLMKRFRAIKFRINNSPTYRDRQCLFTLDEFMDFSVNNKAFTDIYDAWVKSDYAHKMAPTVDRIDNNGGYSLDNIQFLTFGDNSKKGINNA